MKITKRHILGLGTSFLVSIVALNATAASITSNKVLESNLYNRGISQAQLLLLDQKIQSHKYDESMAIIDEGLKKNPNDVKLLYQKAEIYSELEKYDEAYSVLNQISLLQPNNAKANALRVTVETQIRLKPKNELGFDQDEAYVSDLSSYWSYSSLHYYRFTNTGTYGARVNYAHRYGTTGEQYQLEAYPKLSENISLAVTAALANHTQILFPTNQSSLEGYFALPKNFEASIGPRYLKSLGVSIYTWTGSIGKYQGDYFVWFRPYHYTPQSTEFYEVGVRRYFSDKNTYIGLRIGAGKMPDIGDVAPLNQIVILNMKSIALGGQVPITKTFFVKGGLGYSKQHFPSGLVREITDGSLGVVWQF